MHVVFGWRRQRRRRRRRRGKPPRPSGDIECQSFTTRNLRRREGPAGIGQEWLRQRSVRGRGEGFGVSIIECRRFTRRVVQSLSLRYYNERNICRRVSLVHIFCVYTHTHKPTNTHTYICTYTDINTNIILYALVCTAEWHQGGRYNGCERRRRQSGLIPPAFAVPYTCIIHALPPRISFFFIYYYLFFHPFHSPRSTYRFPNHYSHRSATADLKHTKTHIPRHGYQKRYFEAMYRSDVIHWCTHAKILCNIV